MTPAPGLKLSRREREIMDALFSLSEATAEDIRSRLIDPPSYSAVRAMLARLEGKGHIRHREDGLRYVYAPTVSRTAARRDALKQYVGTFFGGSLGTMVTSLVRQESWTDEELDALQAEIERARKEKNR
ncbi:MAG: BlaI/MecI/CopY family transcriptional regulator [Vicinamibacterales bacterium]